MVKPTKFSGSAASPRPAATAPKAGPGTPRSSATSKTVPANGANQAAAAPRSGSGRGSGPEKASCSTKPRGAQESGQPKPATASDGQCRGPRKSDGGAVKSSMATGGVKPPATSYAGGRAKGLPASLPHETVAEGERKTWGQWQNPKWHKYRKNRNTASSPPKIANSKFVNSQTSEVPQLNLKLVVGLGSEVQTPAMNCGVRNEKKAGQSYEAKSRPAKKPVKVKNHGLFVDKEKVRFSFRRKDRYTDQSTSAEVEAHLCLESLHIKKV